MAASFETRGFGGTSWRTLEKREGVVGGGILLLLPGRGREECGYAN